MIIETSKSISSNRTLPLPQKNDPSHKHSSEVSADDDNLELRC